MNIKKMGSFLKELRKEKGLTQEQLAEILGVAGRTVSRWETASNMPDLSILIQLAELYSVDINEIIDGERKNMPMDEEKKENKETLSKIAEYSKAEKEKTVKTISIAYYVTILACFLAFIVQRMLYDDFRMIIGEIVVFSLGISVAFSLISSQGLWDVFFSIKGKPISGVIASAIVAAVLTFSYAIAIYIRTSDVKKVLLFTAICFLVESLLCYLVIRYMAYSSKVNKRRLEEEEEDDEEENADSDE